MQYGEDACKAAAAVPGAVAMGLPVVRMPGGSAAGLTLSLQTATAAGAAESVVQPSSASISAIDCSIFAKVNSSVSAGCMSGTGTGLSSANGTAEGTAFG